MIWGRNTGATNTFTTFRDNASFFESGQRMNRIWKAQNTGTVTGVTVRIPNTTTFPTNGKRVLIVANNAAFNSGVTVYPLSNSGGNYVSSAATIANGQFFTFGVLDVNMWVKADAGVTGAPVSNWNDQSGSQNHLTQGTAGLRPDFGAANAGFNFNPYIEFNQGAIDEYLSKANFEGFGTDGTSHFMVVRRHPSNNASIGTVPEETLFSYATGSEANEYLIVDPLNLDYGVQDFGGQVTGHNLALNKPKIMSALRHSDNTNNNLEVYNDGVVAGPFTYEKNKDIRANGTFMLGQEQDAVGGGFEAEQAFEGDIAEVIIYDRVISPADRIKVESYLGIKYGVTLGHNYVSSNNLALWTLVGGAGSFDNDIAGVGRDNDFALNHTQSHSINANSIVTMQVASLTNLQYVLWGNNAGAYDNFTTTQAPAGMKKSDRIWKVSNPSNNYPGTIDITMVLPPLLLATPESAIQLLVNNASNFSTVTGTHAGTKTGNTITFTGVSLADGEFFTLGLAETLVFINNDPGAPSSWEACANSDISFFYRGFPTGHPDEIIITDTTGNPLSITALTFSNQSSGSGAFNGRVNLTIPYNAGTGPVQFLNGGQVLFSPSNLLVIHNPTLDFAGDNSPLCATDTIKLNGYPSGGTFSSSMAGLIQNDSLIGENAPFDPTQIIKNAFETVPVTYKYLPHYIDGTPCKDSISFTKTLDVRDNRLFDVTFKYEITLNNPATIADRIILDTSQVEDMQPTFSLTNTPDFTFSGTYVQLIGLDYTFLTEQAGFGNFPITVNYNNGGCIAEAEAFLDVYPPIRIPGLSDRLCIEAPIPDTFIRDPLPEYRDTTTTVVSNYSCATVTRTNRRNELIGVYTVNPANNVAIIPISTTTNSERYLFDPKLLPPGTTQVIIEMEYQNTYTYNYSNPCAPYFYSYSYPSTIRARDTINLEARPIVTLDPALDTVYCENSLPDTLSSFPFFDQKPFTSYQVYEIFGNIRDTFLTDSVLDPNYLYNKHVPLQNRDAIYELYYIIDRYGCYDVDTARFTVPVPEKPLFFGRHLISKTYCLNETEDLLTATPSPNSGLGGAGGVFLPAPGIGVDNQGNPQPLFPTIFAPKAAGDGEHAITYQYTDIFGCVSQVTDTLIVRPDPKVQLITASGTNEFCVNDSNVVLNVIPLSGGAADSIKYFGAGVIDTIFNPSAVFSGGAGSSQITVLFIDSFTCQGRDTLDIIIRDIPNPSIQGFNTSITPGINSRYCSNDTVVNLLLSPPITSGLGGVITGNGIIMQDTNAFYNPDWSPQNQDITSSIDYTYTDQYGCSDTYTHIIKIDSIPEVSVLLLDTSYCINGLPVMLGGEPDDNFTQGTGIFGGPGINPNTGAFDPAIAGTGAKVISYTFIDGRQCVNTATDTTTVYGLPDADFIGLDLEYCIDDPIDTVAGINLGGTGYFTGGAIVDSIQGFLLPSNDTIGLRSITYVFTDTFNCTNTSSQNYYIHPSPTISMSGLDSAYCHNGLEDIISVLPAGGSFDTATTSQGFSIVGGGIRFEPDRATVGVNNLTYIFRDIRGCSDTITSNTQVFNVSTPLVTGLDSRYCETQDTITIGTAPSGGVFDGPGILNNTNLFTAYRAGSGVHNIKYTIQDTFYVSTDTLVCLSDTTLTVTVNPLPVPKIYTPSNNSSFCGTDTARYYFDRDTIGTLDFIFTGTGVEIDRIVDSTMIGSVLYYFYDTIYYFNPSTAVLGTNIVSYNITNTWGCTDSIKYTYLVNETFLAQVNIDSAYCESEPPINLPSNLAGIPIIFINNNDTLNVSQYIPNPDYPTTLLAGNKVDTLISLVNNAGCIGRDTQLIQVNTVPQFTFAGSQPDNSYCLNSAPEPLIPSLTGGTFFGNGVLFGETTFRPSIAGVGSHTISYNYTDNATSCSNVFSDTFRVYSNPIVDYAVVGGCENTAVVFKPNNSILGLNGVFQNVLVDSITRLEWNFGDGSDSIAIMNSPNQMDSILHVYNTPGTYMTSLYVENQYYCADSQEIRLVISPKVSSYPYSQDFETDAGNWFAEDVTGQPSSLWEWGTSMNNSGIDVGGDLMWMTDLDSSYTANQSTWVYSPCFDITSLQRPMIKLNYWSDTDPNTDGTVIEYESSSGEWLPLGEVGRGINWFNSPVIIGQPGVQALAPRGWSGQTNGWTDARYKLDAYKTYTNFRIRVAFGSANIAQTDYYDGFAFDDVWIGNRTRNVLLEHFANSHFSGIQNVNQHVYNLVHHSAVNRDVNLIQYQTPFPAIDEFYGDSDDDVDARTLYYGLSSTARAIIDGRSSGNSSPLSIQLNQEHFEVDMLEDPSFGITIDTFLSNGSQVELALTVDAKIDMAQDKYVVYVVITEDSLVYNGTANEIHAVVREILPNSAGKVYNQAWTAGDQVHLNYQWDFNNQPFDPSRFQVIVFVQNDNDSKIYQSESTRDVSGYNIIGVKERPEILDELEELVNLNLYPNPSRDYFHIEFDTPTSTDYDWKLVDVRGVEVMNGMTEEGTDYFTVEHQLPAGMYIFVMHSDGAFTQRKVIVEGN
ncbi:MAG: T9SS type A sorting domain-containing protein [Aureispira sp.]|nr:T9SS type A sorting domain-containing protein [Aureispira sp.]